MRVWDYYRTDAVLRRLLEYGGVKDASNFSLTERRIRDSDEFRKLSSQMTTEYIAGFGENFMRRYKKKASSRFPEFLGELLDQELNVFRSLWDRQYYVFLLDVEYASKRHPGEAYHNPERVFDLMEPLYHQTLEVLQEYNINPIAVATGQGYHFVFSVSTFDSDYTNPDKKRTDSARRLDELGYLEDTLAGKYLDLPIETKRRRVVKPSLGRGFDTSGKLLEYLTHQIIKRYDGSIPVAIGDIYPGNEKQDLINLDLSCYADPLYTRTFRMAFSIHDKHRELNIDIPMQVAIPRKGSLEDLLKLRRNLGLASEYASEITAYIPVTNIDSLLDSYLNSKLAEIHKDFDEAPQDDYKEWMNTYDRFDLSHLPNCAAQIIANPNPALLQPAQIQTLVRILSKQRWHQSHIAGLIRSKYERDHNWDYKWNKYDANRRARVWVRFYTGLIQTGLDEKTDLNCVSHAEKGLCITPNCGKNLIDYR